MLRLPYRAGSARALQQVSAFAVRPRSSAAEVAQDAATAAAAARPADWDSAKPYTALPGPWPLPVIGNLWRFMPGIGEYYNLDVPSLFGKLNRQYGPVVRMAGMMGKPDVVTLFDPDEVERVLRNEGHWPIRRGAMCLDYYFRNLRKEFPVSLVVSQGKEWQDFRTAVNQVMMQPRNTKQYVEPIDRVSQELVDRMRTIRDDKQQMPANFADEISKWALESIVLVALDAKLGVLSKDLSPDSEASRMIEDTHIVFDSIYELDFLPSPWQYVSTPAYRRFVKAMDSVTEVSSKYVNLAMERLKKTPHSDIEDRTYSVLENLLIRTNDPLRAVTMALDMLLAGIDTTGAVVATAMYQLANNPKQQQKLQEELDRVIPDPSKSLTKEQLEQMKYLRACIKEVMRTMPILLGNTRTTVKDLVVAGHQIPSGTMVSMSAAGVIDNETYFPRAKEFLPERWLPEGEHLKGKHPFAFLPFGFGPRMCVGKRFAALEIETILAKAFRNFTMEWNHPPAKTKFHILLRFSDPFTVTVKDRL